MKSHFTNANEIDFYVPHSNANQQCENTSTCAASTTLPTRPVRWPMLASILRGRSAVPPRVHRLASPTPLSPIAKRPSSIRQGRRMAILGPLALRPLPGRVRSCCRSRHIRSQVRLRLQFFDLEAFPCTDTFVVFDCDVPFSPPFEPSHLDPNLADLCPELSDSKSFDALPQVSLGASARRTGNGGY